MSIPTGSKNLDNSAIMFVSKPNKPNIPRPTLFTNQRSLNSTLSLIRPIASLPSNQTSPLNPNLTPYSGSSTQNKNLTTIITLAPRLIKKSIQIQFEGYKPSSRNPIWKPEKKAPYSKYTHGFSRVQPRLSPNVANISPRQYKRLIKTIAPSIDGDTQKASASKVTITTENLKRGIHPPLISFEPLRKILSKQSKILQQQLTLICKEQIKRHKMQQTSEYEMPSKILEERIRLCNIVFDMNDKFVKELCKLHPSKKSRELTELLETENRYLEKAFFTIIKLQRDIIEKLRKTGDSIDLQIEKISMMMDFILKMINKKCMQQVAIDQSLFILLKLARAMLVIVLHTNNTKEIPKVKNLLSKLQSNLEGQGIEKYTLYMNEMLKTC